MTFNLGLLCLGAFLAGLVDAVVGGGGLIQLPALLTWQSQLPIAVLLGTNKSISICGTSLAALQYSRQLPQNWRVLLPAAATGFVCSFLGARAVSLLPGVILRPVVIGLLIAVALYTFRNKRFGESHSPNPSQTVQVRWAVCLGGGLGFYDGFFGPGTGSFLIFAFIGILGFSFLHASAAAKLINLATNLAAVLYFAYTGQIAWHLTLPLAISNMLGALCGTRLAIAKGSLFVRRLFLGVVIAISVKLLWDWGNSWLAGSH
jgi:uncharacterized membrane protein YfcA